MKFDCETIKCLIATSLPDHASWDVSGMSIDYDFTSGKRDLNYVCNRDFVGTEIEFAWAKLRKFGEIDYFKGGGANPLLTIDEETGNVIGLDVERDTNPTFRMNSSIEHFIQSFQLLDTYLSKKKRLPADIHDQMKSIDPDAFEGSEWEGFIQYLFEL